MNAKGFQLFSRIHKSFIKAVNHSTDHTKNIHLKIGKILIIIYMLVNKIAGGNMINYLNVTENVWNWTKSWASSPQHKSSPHSRYFLVFLIHVYSFRAPSVTSTFDCPNKVEVEVTLRLTIGQSVSQSVCLGIEHPCWTWDQILLFIGRLLSEIDGLLSVERPLWREEGPAICSAITQWSESLRTRNHTLLSHLRLPQPGGPDSRIYIPHEQGGLVIPPGICRPQWSHNLWHHRMFESHSSYEYLCVRLFCLCWPVCRWGLSKESYRLRIRLRTERAAKAHQKGCTAINTN
jgi:hypothetical protein